MRFEVCQKQNTYGGVFTPVASFQDSQALALLKGENQMTIIQNFGNIGT
jgi:hypothetical protein